MQLSLDITDFSLRLVMNLNHWEVKNLHLSSCIISDCMQGFDY